MTAVGALFDSSRQLINGPTNVISIAALSATAGIVAVDDKIAAVVLLAFLIGLFQRAITALRLGDLTRYISHSVIVGFTAGASLLLVLDQVKNLFGLQASGDVHAHLLVRFWDTVTHGGAVHAETAALGFGTMAAVVGLRAIKKRLGWLLFPELLVAVVGAAILTATLGPEARGVKVVGDIPAKLPRFRWPALDAERIRALSGSALAIATLGLLEAIAMAKAIAAQTRQKLELNQMKRVRNSDAAGLSVLAGFLERMRDRQVPVILCGVRGELNHALRRGDLLPALGADNVFLEHRVRQTSTLMAIRHAYESLPDPCPTCPRRDAEVRDRVLTFAV